MSIGYRLINARSEEVAGKPAFRSAFKARRCIVPISGFYEWQTIEGQKIKQPWYFQPQEGEILCIAGLWERWGKDGLDIETFTVLTGALNSIVAPVHNRRPVAVPQDLVAAWLDPSAVAGTDVLREIAARPELPLKAHRVSTAVNAPRNNHAGPVEEVTAPGSERLR